MVVGACGQHEDRQAGVEVVQLAADRDAVDVGQPEVEQHEIEPVARGGIKGGTPRGGSDCVVTIAIEGSHDRRRDRLVVLDDQHARHGGRLDVLQAIHQRVRADPCGDRLHEERCQSERLQPVADVLGGRRHADRPVDRVARDRRE